MEVHNISIAFCLHAVVQRWHLTQKGSLSLTIIHFGAKSLFITL